MESIEEIEAQLRNPPKGVDPIKAAASEIHRERRAHAGTQFQLAQCSVTVGKQNEQLLEQNRTINNLRAELAELRAKNPT
jgi:hypothetical protein